MSQKLNSQLRSSIFLFLFTILPVVVPLWQYIVDKPNYEVRYDIATRYLFAEETPFSRILLNEFEVKQPIMHSKIVILNSGKSIITPDVLRGHKKIEVELCGKIIDTSLYASQYDSEQMTVFKNGDNIDLTFEAFDPGSTAVIDVYWIKDNCAAESEFFVSATGVSGKNIVRQFFGFGYYHAFFLLAALGLLCGVALLLNIDKYIKGYLEARLNRKLFVVEELGFHVIYFSTVGIYMVAMYLILEYLEPDYVTFQVSEFKRIYTPR